MLKSLLFLCCLATTALGAPSRLHSLRSVNATDVASNQALIEQLDLAATASARLALLPDPKDHIYDFLNPPFSSLVTTGKGRSRPNTHSSPSPYPKPSLSYPAKPFPQLIPPSCRWTYSPRKPRRLPCLNRLLTGHGARLPLPLWLQHAPYTPPIRRDQRRRPRSPRRRVHR